MKSIKLLRILFLLSVVNPIFSMADNHQSQRKITGQVTDTNGEVLIGVNIVEIETTNGTITDENGFFSIILKTQHPKLKISYIGYKEVIVNINSNDQFINVTLDEDTELLSEIVVVGYGQQKKETVTGAINSISSKEILQSPVPSVSNAITGKLPGLTAIQRSGEPGKDGATIKIRGIGTLNSGAESDPLILVDGVERSSMDMLDPNEIQSFNILKDASATAVFGVRGANGVILITTKTGEEGKPQISFSTNIGFQSYTMMPKLVNSYEWATLRNEGTYNELGANATLPFDEIALEAYKNHTDPIVYPDVDWVDKLLRPFSLQQQYNINVSGGTKVAKYFISFGMLDQDGIYREPKVEGLDFPINPNYKRYNLRTNFDVNISRDIVANFKMGTIFTDSDYPRMRTNLLFDMLLRTNPLGGPGTIDDKLITGYSNDPLEGRRSLPNPINDLVQEGYQKVNTNTYNVSLGLKYSMDYLLKGLSFRGMVAYDDYYSHTVARPKSVPTYTIVIDENEPDGYFLTRTGDESAYGFSESFNSRFRNLYWETAADYSNKFGQHNVTGLLLYYQKKEDDPSFEYGVPKGLLGLVGRMTYNFSNRYMAEVNLGYNGSEQFMEGKRMGFFPAFSAAWIMSEEPFFKENDIITFFKIRGSHGEVGNDKIGKSRFLYLPSVFVLDQQGYYFGEKGSSRQPYSGAAEGKIGNPNITWERAKKSNLGLELRMFNSQLSLAGDVFIEKRDNILWDYGSIPGIVGANLPAANLGKVENKGFEIEAGWNSKVQNVEYWTKGTFSFARNKVIYMDEANMSEKYLMQTGYSVGQYKGYKTEGFINTQEQLDNSPAHGWGGTLWGRGELNFIDINGDGVINSYDMVPIGYGPYPEISYGFNLGAEWRNFSISAFFQGVANVSLYLKQSAINPIQFGTRSAQDWHLGRWSEERWLAGEKITYPRMLVQNEQSPSFVDGYADFWIQNANYLRLKNLELGYRLTTEYLKKVGITGIRFYVNGTNLLTFTGVKNFDPEAPAGTGTFYPQTKIYNVGFNIHF